MPFAYYANLSAAKKKIYRKSDSIEHIPIKNAADIHPYSVKLKNVLEANQRSEVAKCASDICKLICRDLGIPGTSVRIRAKRPSRSTEELHGLYEFTEGERPIITVWMKTAAKKQVVAFKSFIRTVLHELCHHIDYAYYKLPDSLHTEGFFRRESRLYKEIVPAALQTKKPARKKAPQKAKARKPAKGKARAASKKPRKTVRKEPEQMELL